MKEKELKAELKAAMKAKDAERCNAIKMVLGEVPRLNKKKDDPVTEEEINGIITKLIKSEVALLEYAKMDETKSEYLSVLRSYLPKMMTVEEIRTWVLDNVDFSAYNNKMKAMGFIMKGLQGKADGNVVKKVLDVI